MAITRFINPSTMSKPIGFAHPHQLASLSGEAFVMTALAGEDRNSKA
jgi:hypothetical protein